MTQFHDDMKAFQSAWWLVQKMPSTVWYVTWFFEFLAHLKFALGNFYANLEKTGANCQRAEEWRPDRSPPKVQPWFDAIRFVKLSTFPSHLPIDVRADRHTASGFS